MLQDKVVFQTTVFCVRPHAQSWVLKETFFLFVCCEELDRPAQKDDPTFPSTFRINKNDSESDLITQHQHWTHLSDLKVATSLQPGTKNLWQVFPNDRRLFQEQVSPVVWKDMINTSFQTTKLFSPFSH